MAKGPTKGIGILAHNELKIVKNERKSRRKVKKTVKVLGLPETREHSDKREEEKMPSADELEDLSQIIDYQPLSGMLGYNVMQNNEKDNASKSTSKQSMLSLEMAHG